jgi:uncharacterized membrane protein
MRWSAGGYLLLLLAALLWSGGFFTAPLLHAAGHDELAIFSRMFYAPVCHQEAARSYALFDWPLSVCHRCSAIYLSFTAVLLFYPALRRFSFFHSLPLSRLAIFILPMVLDYVLDVLGLWSNGAMSRTISGIVAGSGLAVFTIPAWMEVWTQRKRHHNSDHREVTA